MTYPHNYIQGPDAARYPRCRCGETSGMPGERGDNCPAAMREHIAELSRLQASIVKALADERAAVVAWLHVVAEERTDDSLHADADAIERGDHHKENDHADPPK